MKPVGILGPSSPPREAGPPEAGRGLFFSTPIGRSPPASYRRRRTYGGSRRRNYLWDRCFSRRETPQVLFENRSGSAAYSLERAERREGEAPAEPTMDPPPRLFRLGGEPRPPRTRGRLLATRRFWPRPSISGHLIRASSCPILLVPKLPLGNRRSPKLCFGHGARREPRRSCAPKLELGSERNAECGALEDGLLIERRAAQGQGVPRSTGCPPRVPSRRCSLQHSSRCSRVGTHGTNAPALRPGDGLTLRCALGAACRWSGGRSRPDAGASGRARWAILFWFPSSRSAAGGLRSSASDQMDAGRRSRESRVRFRPGAARPCSAPHRSG